MRTVFRPVERFLAIGSADCHWIVALLCLLLHWWPCPLQSTTRKNFRRTNTENVQNNAILRNFYQFLAHFCHFFAHSFPQRVIIVPENAGTIANKFQLHT